MKKFSLNCSIVFGLILSAVSCSKDHDQPPAPNNPTEFTVHEARTFFESNARVMRPLDLRYGRRNESVADLTHSDMVPLWDKARAYRTAQAEVVEVPLRIFGAYRAYAHFADSTRSDLVAEGAVIVHLLVQRDSRTRAGECFLTTFIPDKSFTEGNKEKLEKLCLYLKEESGYTGLVIRSEMDGKPRGGLRYANGRIVSRLRSGHRAQEGIILIGLQNIPTKNITIYRGPEYEGMPWCKKCLFYHPQSEGGCMSCEDIGIVGQKPDKPSLCDGCGQLIQDCKCCLECGRYPCVCPIIPPMPDPPGLVFPTGPGSGGSGGGTSGGNSGSGPSGEGSSGVAREAECGPQAEANGNGALNRLIQFMDVGLQSQFIDPFKGAGVEHGAVLNFNSATGKMEMDNTFTSNDQHEVTMLFKTEKDKKSVACIHNHPANNAPSPGDAITTAQANYHTGGVYTTSFVVTADGTIYALQVEDAARAKVFYEYYKEPNNKKALDDEYVSLATAIQEDYRSIEYKDIYVYTTAYMLNLHDTGIKLLVKEPGSSSFKQKDAYGDPNHTTRITCK